MSLYHEAAQSLTTPIEHGGSLKSIIFGNNDLKSDRKTLFALCTESAKYSRVLSEVIEKSELLKHERQLTPVLALLLTHDLLLSKRGVALPAKHGLHTTITRHKARLSAELTKARLRRGCPNLEALRSYVDEAGDILDSHNSEIRLPKFTHPRWVRINTIRTSLSEQLETTFSEYQRVDDLLDIVSCNTHKAIIYVDEHVPDLVAVPGRTDLSFHKAYKEGILIFQEKASCFPAVLLDPGSILGDILDACAAPGNKTTHLAALATAPTAKGAKSRKVIACEKDAARSGTLAKMVKLAGAERSVNILQSQDFMRLDPEAEKYAKVKSLLLDPSCSGSGIVGRDEATLTVHLPSRVSTKEEASRGKKRKRGDAEPVKIQAEAKTNGTEVEEESPTTMEEDEEKLKTRLTKLSGFQLRLLERAMSFPAAKRITYSTCSLHEQENEHVVAKALLSEIACQRGWRILRRDEQVEGMRKWKGRGDVIDVVDVIFNAIGTECAMQKGINAEQIAEGCIRCEKGGDGSTMGFFVAAFVRDNKAAVSPPSSPNGANGVSRLGNDTLAGGEGDGNDVEWEGFSDNEG